MGKDKLAPCIMFQGTSSDAGKSVLATAVCRILAKKGYKVAPFKAQNMANNSYVTGGGLEIGRAQGAQAEAAMVEPEEAMNPILLKPSSDGVSQVVLMGKALEEIKAKEYRENWVPYLWRTVKEAILDLRKRYDFVIMEGAGSPAEINLRQRDLTNMEVAGEVGARVVLVSDIEKGGMLASVVGTLELLESWERELVHGVVVNKFRGDYSLLEPGLEFLENKTGKPVLGVIPYFYEHLVEAEDSLSLSTRVQVQTGRIKEQNNEREIVKAGVINLDRISNFTDFDPLEDHAGIKLEYLPLEKEIEDIDCLIFPGTKATREDLVKFLESNLYRSLKEKEVFNTVPVMGICGGYQMLGKEIKDYEGIAGKPGELKALGLLPVITEFCKNKNTVRVQCKVQSNKELFSPLKDEVIAGYQIHMGKTRVIDESSSWLFDTDSNPVGIISWDDRVIGTNLHDIFTNECFLHWFLGWVKSWKLYKEAGGTSTFYYKDSYSSELNKKRRREEKETRYNKLAEIVENNLDMKSLLNGMIEL